MKIRRSATPSPVPPLSPSSCSSSSSCFSTPSTPHSTISDHSLSSSSSSSSFSLLPNHRNSRCEGLDLLVKAVYHVAGSVVGVPYIQRRIIRRRKPAVRFCTFLIGSQKEEEREFDNDERGEVFDGNSDEQKKQRRRSKILSAKLQSSKMGNRRRRRSKV